MSQADAGMKGVTDPTEPRRRAEIGRAESLSEEATPSGPLLATSPLELAVGPDAARRYEAALARLATRDRDVVRGRIELQWSYRKLAEELGTTTAAARARVTRALGRLIEAMSE
jgi:DNA-directed RNA polymerase specialized sigma24 family protein